MLKRRRKELEIKIESLEILNYDLNSRIKMLEQAGRERLACLALLNDSIGKLGKLSHSMWGFYKFCGVDLWCIIEDKKYGFRLDGIEYEIELGKVDMLGNNGDFYEVLDISK